MDIQSLHNNFIMPTKGSEEAAAYDIYMPEDGIANGETKVIPLGFATAIPRGLVALLLPRSGVGSKYGLEVNNTCGVIDEDYRGEWKAALRTKSGLPYSWKAGDRILQFLLVPVFRPQLVQVDALPESGRGSGGFGSSGK